MEAILAIIGPLLNAITACANAYTQKLKDDMANAPYARKQAALAITRDTLTAMQNLRAAGNDAAADQLRDQLAATAGPPNLPSPPATP